MADGLHSGVKLRVNDGLRSANFPGSIGLNPLLMKLTSLFSLFVLMLPLAAQNEIAEAEKAAVAAKEALLPNQQEFLNLPGGEPQKFHQASRGGQPDFPAKADL